MTVKAVRGRRRYIAFTLDASLTRQPLIAKLHALAAPDDPPYVVQCAEGWAIVRCAPKQRERTIALMLAADPTSAALLTSGTLATLRDRYPKLKSTRPPARK